MGKTHIRYFKVLILFIALSLFLVLSTSIAWATSGNNLPHGGYSTSSDVCLQCHDIHEASADYVLLRYETVADTCGSCHYLYLQNPGDMPVNASNPVLGGYDSKSPISTNGSYDTTTPPPPISPAYDPGYGGTKAIPIGLGASIGSPYSAYEVSVANAPNAYGHQLQRGSGTWNFNDGTTNTADYIPGGSSLLKAIQLDGDNDASTMNATTDTLAFTATNGLFCVSCHTPHGYFGRILKNTSGLAYSGKILSGKPNHVANAYNDPNDSGSGSLRVNNHGEMRKWCSQCHNKRITSATGVHTHPEVVCTNGCHGWNYQASPGQQSPDMPDFPHTGDKENLLMKEPDALCLTCHISGYLP